MRERFQVKSGGAVDVEVFLDLIDAWRAARDYPVDAQVRASDGNIYQAAIAGRSGTGPPVWRIDQNVADNEITWAPVLSTDTGLPTITATWTVPAELTLSAQVDTEQTSRATLTDAGMAPGVWYLVTVEDTATNTIAEVEVKLC